MYTYLEITEPSALYCLNIASGRLDIFEYSTPGSRLERNAHGGNTGPQGRQQTILAISSLFPPFLSNQNAHVKTPSS